MSNKPTSSDDASSISNQPLIPKQGVQKDYEAAVGALMSAYGLSSTVAVPVTKKKKDKKTKSSKPETSTGGGASGQSGSNNSGK